MGIDIRRILIGAPLATSAAIHQRLSKAKALAVFSSDALSSTAYATEAIMLVLVAAGTSALGLSMGISVGIALLLVIVAFSYYQTIHAYPTGGGAYIVAKENLGKWPGLTAAAALLIDYVLTVAVSVSAGVAALTSAFPALEPFRVELALIIVAFITLMNLRGMRESGTFFAIPTYAFLVGVLVMIAIGVVRVLSGDVPPGGPQAVHFEEGVRESFESLTLFLFLRAFAGGCTALTGVEAISDGIPAFKPPESKNASQTLIVMVILLCVMFIGITFLANNFPIQVSDAEIHPTVLSQLAGNIFGQGSLGFYYMQFATLLILSLAANTAFADFPRLASLIARDRYLPRQLTGLGDRLVFSNGIILLAALAGVLIIIFGAREHNLLPLYAVGVFLSFTLSQAGMVIRWLKMRNLPDFQRTTGWLLRIFLNGFGAFCTFVVLLVLLVTKFTEGAWIVAVAIPLTIMMFLGIRQHYETVRESLSLDGLTPFPLSATTYANQDYVPVVVLLNSLNRASLQALEYAIRISDNVRAVTVEIEPEQVDRLQERWEQWHVEIPLDIIESPYRAISGPLVEYLHEHDEKYPDKVPTMVVMPEFVVTRWWERYLHNQTARAVRAALYADQITCGRGRPVIEVPYRIGEELYTPILSPNGDSSPASETPETPVLPTLPDAADTPPTES